MLRLFCNGNDFVEIQLLLITDQGNSKMAEQNSSYNSRPLSDLERRYIDWLLKPQQFVSKWVNGGAGCISIVFGVALSLAFIFDNTNPIPESKNVSAILLGLLFVAFTVGFGVIFVRNALRRKSILNDRTSCITGVLKEQTAHIPNPRTGAVTTTKRYMVGDFQVTFPEDCDELFIDHINKPVEFVAAILSISNPLVIFGGKSAYDEPATSAIVLEFYDKINIHKAMEKYGIWTFRARRHRYIMMPLFFIPICFYGMYLMEDMVPSFASVVVLFLVSSFLTFIFIFLYEQIIISLGYIDTQIPYREKLKG